MNNVLCRWSDSDSDSMLSEYSFDSDHSDTDPAGDLLWDYDENFARVTKLADDLVYESHDSLLSHLCGDLSLPVVWKIMFLSDCQPLIEDRMTMLSLITEYVAFSDVAEKSPQLPVTLASVWESNIKRAKLELSDSSFIGIVNTLDRCFRHLLQASCSNAGLARVLTLAENLEKKDRSQIHMVATKPDEYVHFPSLAVLPFQKLRKILNAGHKKHEKSLDSGYKKHKKSLDSGFKKSLDSGHKNSLDSGHKKHERSLDSGFKKSLDSGFKKSLDSGYKSSLDSGFKNSLDSACKKHGKSLDSNYKKSLDSEYKKSLDSSFKNLLDSGYKKHENSLDSGFKKHERSIDSAFKKHGKSWDSGRHSPVKTLNTKDTPSAKSSQSQDKSDVVPLKVKQLNYDTKDETDTGTPTNLERISPVFGRHPAKKRKMRTLDCYFHKENVKQRKLNEGSPVKCASSGMGSESPFFSASLRKWCTGSPSES